MNLDAVMEIARQTPTFTLCEAWSLSPAMVLARLEGERTLTVREVAALAELNGMQLADVLAL